MKNWRFSTNISLYFENGTRYSHILQRKINRDSYAIYRMMPFPMTFNDPNLEFKVTPIFDAEYLSGRSTRQTDLGLQCLTSKKLHTPY